MSFRAMWFGASAVDPSSAEVAGDVRAPVANHSSIATRSYVCPSSTQKTGSFMISQVIGQHLRGWCRVDGVTSACLEGRRGEQIFRQFTNPKPLDLFAMLSERFLEDALMFCDVVEYVLRL